MKDQQLPVIEEGYPIPPIKRRATAEYEQVISTMKVENSIFVPKNRKNTATRCIERLFGKKSFVARDVDLDYCRVWRVK